VSGGRVAYLIEDVNLHSGIRCMSIRIITLNERHLRYRAAVLAAMRAEGDDLSAEEVLALTAHVIGQLVALQDQRTMSPARAMAIISRNIVQGNAEVVEGLLGKTEGTA
jgi:hypothetical protein